MSGTSATLTNLIKHLVALVKDEHFQIPKGQVLVSNERIESTRRPDDDVGELFLVLQELDIFRHGCTTIEDCGLDIWQVLAESRVLVLDLEGQFSSVTHNEHLALAGNRIKRVKRGQHEDGGLTETRLGLANDIDVEECSWNTLLLNCGPTMLDLDS